ncbi:MAG: helix-turn-helix transcriptional regulator [Oscillospiraceae bacterium]|nr:helix-turn-helix transcriptional regulator [Oscillospiraceae bacterium]
MDYTESVKRSMDYICSHLEDELSAEKIAASEGYSVFHFCRIFKEYTGKSLMRYVREKRLEKAEKEIENGEPASCVAIKYGFETQSGFSRAFAKQFGERPAKKRNA